MMTSDTIAEPARAYVWIWLPGATAPVVAGLVQRAASGTDTRQTTKTGERSSAGH